MTAERCDRAHHRHAASGLPLGAESIPMATVVLRCAGCGKVIARCAACEESYAPGNAANTMRAHLRATYCLSRAARGQR